MMRRLAFVAVLPFLFLASLFAQAPEKINYQAVVRDTDGTLIKETEIRLRISLRKGGIDGQSVYSEIHSLETNEYGLVSLAIGTGTSPDKFTDIDWAEGGAMWIKIELDPQGGTNYREMGGMELVSVPYSLFAASAGSAPPVLQSMTESERESLEDPAPGMMILNTTTNMINVYKADGWYELGDEKISESFSCGKHLTDPRDGKSYNTVKIGDQCWMAENLDVGTMIDGALDMTDNDQIEKYCYQNSSSMCDTYGALYQWDELMNYTTVKSSQGICPDGWHVPSDMEVQELEIALGMDSATAAMPNTWRGSDQGTKMAMGGSSGYEALFSGRRVTGGLYSAIESYEYLWTSSESAGMAWRRCLRVADPKIGRYDTFPKNYGMSVRCVMD